MVDLRKNGQSGKRLKGLKFWGQMKLSVVVQKKEIIVFR